MKPSLLVLAAVAILAATASAASQPSERPVGAGTLYGHIRSLTRTGRSFQMRFDPAWWLSGRPAERAKLEDTGSADVPNDYYIVEEGHRLLTYVVPATARVTVLTGGVQTTRITVSELAEIVKGRNPRHRRLFEPKAGFWIQVGARYPSPVLALYQQYQP
jgi:hypothetical protein